MCLSTDSLGMESGHLLLWLNNWPSPLWSCCDSVILHEVGDTGHRSRERIQKEFYSLVTISWEEMAHHAGPLRDRAETEPCTSACAMDSARREGTGMANRLGIGKCESFQYTSGHWGHPWLSCYLALGRLGQLYSSEVWGCNSEGAWSTALTDCFRG